MTERREFLRAAGALALPAALPGSVRAAPEFTVREVFEVGSGVYVRALTAERGRDALWVGTSSGVHEVDLRSMALRNTFTRKEGLANEYVFAIGVDRDGWKWFGTNAGGVSRYRDGQWKTFFPMHGLADYWVYAFANQSDGSFWIGTWAGVNRYEPATGRFQTYMKELINEWVYGIAVDRADRVWFGTEGGVSMFDGRRWQSWTHRDGLGAANDDDLPPSTNTGLGTRTRHDLSISREGVATYNPNYVFAMHAAPDGSVWAGTWGGGVSRFDGSRWTNLTARDGLAGNIVYAIAQEPDGAFWFGTNRGLSRYDGNRWQNFGRAQGLLEEHVYAVEVVHGGAVWAGTRRGVVRIAGA